MAIPGEDASLLNSLTQQGGCPQIRKLFESLGITQARLLPLGYPNSCSRSALALPALLTRRLSQALSSSDRAIASHGFVRSTLSCCCSQQGDKKNTTLQFLLGCLCLTHSAEHCCPHLEHLFPLWSLLLWGIPLTTSSSASKLKSLEGFVKWEMMGGRREKLHRNQAETVPNKTRMPTE